jgi:hypothetical protein
MSDPKKGTGKKPKGSGRRLYTDENPKDTVSVEFSSAAAIKRTLAKPSFKSKSHKRQSQIINLIHQRARAAYQNAKDPKVKARLKKAFEYAEQRKEASKRKTKRMQKSKKNEEMIKDVIMQEILSVLDEQNESLRDWFGKSKSKGKGGKPGWVQAGGRYDGKPCARQPGQKTTPKCVSRSKYDSMSKKERESAARRKRRKDPGQTKKTGAAKPTYVKTDPQKRGRKKKNESINLETIIKEELQRAIFKPGLLHHVENKIPVTENVYRPGSPCFFNVIKQARHFYKKGLYEVLSEEERDLLENSELGEWVIVEGEKVPLEFPLFIDENINEQKKKDPPLNKPTRNTGSGKKYKVFVRDPKSGNIRKVTYGDSKGGLKGGWNSPAARKSFAARHRCAEKKDKTKPGYWACRAHKDFGPGVGRFW